MGEWTAVASANRGVLGGLASDDDVESEFVVETELADMVRAGVRFKASGRLFSSKPMVVEDSDVGNAASRFFIVLLMRKAYMERRSGRKKPVFVSSSSSVAQQDSHKKEG
jgi:hypothetical protein